MKLNAEKTKRVIVNILIVLSSTLVLILLIETAFRVYNGSFDRKKSTYERALSNDIAPSYVIFHIKGNFRSKELNTNSLGFRAKEFSEYKNKNNKCRVLVFGGSVMFGWDDSSDSATIPVYLERALNKKYATDKFEVVNMSYPAYISNQELILYLMYGTELGPDIVLTFDGYNDMAIGLTENDLGDPAGFSKFSKAYKLLNGDFRYLPFVLINGSQFFSYVRYAISTRIRKSQSALEEDKRTLRIEPDFRIVDYYLDNIRKFSKFSKKLNGAKHVAVLQPVIYEGKKLTEPERKIDELCFVEKGPMLKMYDHARTGMKRIAVEEDGLFIDATYFFKDVRETIFFDNCHLNDAGNEILAVNIAEEIHNRYPEILKKTISDKER